MGKSSTTKGSSAAPVRMGGRFLWLDVYGVFLTLFFLHPLCSPFFVRKLPLVPLLVGLLGGNHQCGRDMT